MNAIIDAILNRWLWGNISVRQSLIEAYQAGYQQAIKDTTQPLRECEVGMVDYDKGGEA